MCPFVHVSLFYCSGEAQATCVLSSNLICLGKNTAVWCFYLLCRDSWKIWSFFKTWKTTNRRTNVNRSLMAIHELEVHIYTVNSSIVIFFILMFNNLFVHFYASLKERCLWVFLTASITAPLTCFRCSIIPWVMLTFRVLLSVICILTRSGQKLTLMCMNYGHKTKTMMAKMLNLQRGHCGV